MKQMAKKAVALLLDVCKAAAIGIGVAAVLGLVLAGGGALFGSNGLHSAVEAAKDGLLLVFAVLLLIVAGMLLIKGKKQELAEINLQLEQTPLEKRILRTVEFHEDKDNKVYFIVAKNSKKAEAYTTTGKDKVLKIEK